MNEIMKMYIGSSGEATKQIYNQLYHKGITGKLALNLLRAQKCSSRAKVYHGGIPGKGSYKHMAYKRKQWSLDNVCNDLIANAAILGIRWGWKVDSDAMFTNPWVLYVDLPRGQVSFHSPTRGEGPDYPGEFDGQHKSEIRIIQFAQTILDTE